MSESTTPQPALRTLIDSPGVDSVDSFKRAIADATEHELGDLKSAIERGEVRVHNAERATLTMAVEQLQEQMDIEKDLTHLQARLEMLRMLAGDTPSLAPASASLSATASPDARFDPEALRRFDAYVSSFATTLSFPLTPIIALVQSSGLEKFVGIDSKDTSAAALKKIFLQIAASPSLIGISEQTPFLGKIVGKFAAMARHMQQQERNAPQRAAADAAQAAEREVQEKRTAALRTAMPNIQTFTEANGSVSLRKNPDGSVVLAAPASLPERDHAALNTLAAQLRGSSRLRVLQPAGPEMPTDAARVRFLPETGTVQFGVPDGGTLAAFAALGLPDQIKSVHRETLWRYDTAARAWVQDTPRSDAVDDASASAASSSTVPSAQ